ncbi:MAG TPA: DUF1294 domain-containing protein [Geobacteraceae bacterium]|nr:DUF1294 domain-containing protein [Geobacteraceae bacterium]
MPHPNLTTLYLIASALAFTAYGIDKAAAVGGRWRIPEALLHLLGLVGGWPGALVAQRIFRHKTRKAPFRVVFWSSAVLNTAVALWFLSAGQHGTR